MLEACMFEACIKCRINKQSPGVEPLCGTCWAKDTSNKMDWPSYAATTQAMLLIGKCCKYCHRELYALPGDDRNADVCTDCY